MGWADRPASTPVATICHNAAQLQQMQRYYKPFRCFMRVQYIRVLNLRSLICSAYSFLSIYTVPLGARQATDVSQLKAVPPIFSPGKRPPQDKRRAVTAIKEHFKKNVERFCRLLPPAVGSNSVPAAVALLLSNIATNITFVHLLFHSNHHGRPWRQFPVDIRTHPSHK